MAHRAKSTVKATLWGLFLVALNCWLTSVAANVAQVKEPARTIAVGPFFAPDGNDTLRKISVNVPDLLTVELSQQEEFHLVERDKVTAIWNELNLSASGMVTPETVARLGHELACDWLITGTLVRGKTNTQVWAKVIDVKSSVVLDLQALPFDAGNLPATIQGIASFVAKAGSQRQAGQFVTLGRFTDLSPDRSREDWSGRIRVLIEQHCRDAHMGLVEREAIGPIFEEFQFERAGLTGTLTNRVRLQPAFWIVDGACKWVNDTQLKVTIRLQKVGGREQLIELIQNAGPQLESAVLATLKSVLEAPGENSKQMGLDESKLHDNRGMEAANNNDRFSRLHNISTQYDAHGRPSAEHTRDLQENRRSAIESFQKALLLNPKDVHAKYMLGYALIGDHDPAQAERGKELLKEVAALNDPNFSKQAALYVEYPEMFHQEINVGGTTTASAAAREASRSKAFQAAALERFGKAFESNPTSTQAKFDFGMVLINEHDEARKNRGKQLLKEIAASNDPKLSKFAARRLEADQIAAQGGRMTAEQLAKAEKEGDEAFEEAYRRNPTSVNAKLGYASILVTKEDSAQRERGKSLLKEIIALNDPQYSKQAARYLEHSAMFIKTTNGVPRMVLLPTARPEDYIRAAKAAHQPIDRAELDKRTAGMPDHIRAKIETVAFEEPYRLNPTDAHATFDYGFALLRSRNEGEHERGKKLLQEVAASNDPTYSKLAATRLERDEPPSNAKQAEFLQRNFSKLVPIKLEAPTDSEARIQILHVKEHLFEYDGRYYCGFQFTAPEWLDGDLEWMYFLAKTEANKGLAIERMSWYVVPESGTIRGKHRINRDEIPVHPHLKQQFPYTYNLNLIETDKERIEAGRPNAVWFEFEDQNVCDIAFALTIDSQRGAKEFGALPLR